jgi:nucleoside-diphosphate-sugar epimerase
MSQTSTKILVTGAAGQIGSELTPLLRKKFGCENVLASDIRTDANPDLLTAGPFEILDVTDSIHIQDVIERHEVGVIYHMSAVLSAVGEQNPKKAWDVNINGTHNVLRAAQQFNLAQVFIPSSIAVFGPETPKEQTPQDTVLKPKTIYGISKVTGELLCEYYVRHFGLDVRGCRYPGIISHETLPGGGTTDYAVEIFYQAVKNKKYTCFVDKDTRLPMMYMPDCLKATVDLMKADYSRLTHHADFNISGMSFSVEELAGEIKKHIPDFTIEYRPDYRQRIADSWPKTIDDTAARQEWGWKPTYDLVSMTENMLEVLQKRYQEGKLP